jgi:hypothetical protein
VRRLRRLRRSIWYVSRLKFYRVVGDVIRVLHSWTVLRRDGSDRVRRYCRSAVEVVVTNELAHSPTLGPPDSDWVALCLMRMSSWRYVCIFHLHRLGSGLRSVGLVGSAHIADEEDQPEAEDYDQER